MKYSDGPLTHKHPSVHFRGPVGAGLHASLMGALWRANPSSAQSTQVCIQIKMTDKDIKAQWHFANLWYYGWLLFLRGLKLKLWGICPFLSPCIRWLCGSTVVKQHVTRPFTSRHCVFASVLISATVAQVNAMSRSWLHSALSMHDLGKKMWEITVWVIAVMDGNSALKVLYHAQSTFWSF